MSPLENNAYILLLFITTLDEYTLHYVTTVWSSNALSSFIIYYLCIATTTRRDANSARQIEKVEVMPESWAAKSAGTPIHTPYYSLFGRILRRLRLQTCSSWDRAAATLVLPRHDIIMRCCHAEELLYRRTQCAAMSPACVYATQHAAKVTLNRMPICCLPRHAELLFVFTLDVQKQEKTPEHIAFVVLFWCHAIILYCLHIAALFCLAAINILPRAIDAQQYHLFYWIHIITTRHIESFVEKYRHAVIWRAITPHYIERWYTFDERH